MSAIKVTKGDVARQPALCEEIAELRVKRLPLSARLRYLNSKENLSPREEAGKKDLEGEVADLTEKIDKLYAKVKGTTAADVNEVITTGLLHHQDMTKDMDETAKFIEKCLKDIKRGM